MSAWKVTDMEDKPIYQTAPAPDDMADKPHWTDCANYRRWRRARRKAGLPTRKPNKLPPEMLAYYRVKQRGYRLRDAGAR